MLCQECDNFARIFGTYTLDSRGSYQRIRAALKDVRLAAGEGEFTASGFLPFLEKGLLDVVQPDIARCSGFTGSPRFARGGWRVSRAG